MPETPSRSGVMWSGR